MYNIFINDLVYRLSAVLILLQQSIRVYLPYNRVYFFRRSQIQRLASRILDKGRNSEGEVEKESGMSMLKRNVKSELKIGARWMIYYAP